MPSDCEAKLELFGFRAVVSAIASGQCSRMSGSTKLKSDLLVIVHEEAATFRPLL
jgi:hypothetical protein